MDFWKKNSYLLALVLLAAIFHAQFLSKKKEQVASFSERFEKMQALKSQELKRHNELKLCISSQSDPAWIEMILMRDLGVVPEGFVKVHFKK